MTTFWERSNTKKKNEDHHVKRNFIKTISYRNGQNKTNLRRTRS